jgi:hypothetical protein
VGGTAESGAAPVPGASPSGAPPAPSAPAPEAATGAAPPAGPAPAPEAGAAPPAPASTGQRVRLVGKRLGATTSDEIPLLADRLLVGRFDPETGPVDIDLGAAPEAEHISRQHAELYREADGRWFVRDLGSANGVFVKGETSASFGPRITEPRSLSQGDEIAFGNARFVFRTD